MTTVKQAVDSLDVARKAHILQVTSHPAIEPRLLAKAMQLHSRSPHSKEGQRHDPVIILRGVLRYRTMLDRTDPKAHSFTPVNVSDRQLDYAMELFYPYGDDGQ